ncbi:helix-turn-helix transcriptional regulator [Streptomyces sp. CB00455]|uniref:helix-turn-helix transcriptional regulator n=1 Tax=Streptomyces sp. CB00455 TaxID=1703927 RepID=UPI000B106233|nr:helix-turn-helix domain-containing protein [Streptomyces sp. CB00455]
MPDVFDRIEWAVRDLFREEPVCVHVGNVEECEIKRHPTYPRFRASAIRSGRSAPTSRLWESMITMGRLCDLDGDQTWRLVILDCITPCFRPLSASIARDFRIECEEIRSAMTATALEVWADTAMSVPPRHVRDRMVKAAFDVAFRRGRAASSECSADDVEIFRPESNAQDSTLRALSIIDVNSIRDAGVAEQIRGERFGSLLHMLGYFDVVRGFHDQIRAGRRSGSVSQAMKVSRPTQSQISGQSSYYYASDLYPSFIGLREAAGVMGIAESAAHRLIRAGQFPFPVARAGRSYKVSVRALMRFMDIPDAIVHVDDVENGALHASGCVR